MRKDWILGIILLVCVTTSCKMKSSRNQNSPHPRIIANEGTTVLRCWFVEENGHGQSGYVAIDGRLGHEPPEGGGLFKSITEVRDAISRQQIPTPDVEPSFGGVIPKGWKIRSLTQDELHTLRLAK